MEIWAWNWLVARMASTKAGMVAHTCHACSEMAKGGGPPQSHSQLRIKFKASLGYISQNKKSGKTERIIGVQWMERAYESVMIA